MSAVRPSPFARPVRDATYMHPQETPPEVAELTSKVLGQPVSRERERGTVKVSTHLTKEEHRLLRMRVAEMDTTIEQHLYELLFPNR